MRHVGFDQHRLAKSADNPREVAFAKAWLRENRMTGGRTPLIAHLVPGLTDRDARVAATAIQWLGTNVGISFLCEVIEHSDEIRDYLAYAFRPKRVPPEQLRRNRVERLLKRVFGREEPTCP